MDFLFNNQTKSFFRKFKGKFFAKTFAWKFGQAMNRFWIDFPEVKTVQAFSTYINSKVGFIFEYLRYTFF